MQKINCMNCGSILFELSAADENGNKSIIFGTNKSTFNSDGTRSYYVCHNCNAKNITIDSLSKNGVSQHQIYKYEM